jgi:hypothetical protein
LYLNILLSTHVYQLRDKQRKFNWNKILVFRFLAIYQWEYKELAAMEEGFEDAQLYYCRVVHQYLTSIPYLYLLIN